MTEFVPHLTPAQMLELGVFGGAYFQRATLADLEQLPPDVLRLVDANRGPFRTTRNCYRVRSGMSYQDWVDKGWIFPEDPLGWFHWYCRYAAGRRHERDAHQIHRWAYFEERWGRHARAQMRVQGYASPVVLQGLLQWGYEPQRVLERVDPTDGQVYCP